MLTKQEIERFFTRCFVVNLARRQDRREHIQKNVVPQWPLGKVELFNAIDGQICQPPPWWKAGRGAWGVFRSHSELVQRCLNERVRSVLILEDDAVLVDGFTEKVNAFLSAVPPTWDMLYLGGQHLWLEEHPPQQINEQVWKAYNVNRCHAMAISQKGMLPVYQWLCRRDWGWHTGEKGKRHQDHIDHHLGRLVMQGSLEVYTPPVWLVGQAEGKSNICGADLDRRYWKGADPLSGQKVIAVVGTYRSGTSCVAGMLHKLGASMGDRFFQGREVDSPKGCYEALALYQVCMNAYGEPNFKELNTYKKRVHQLRKWLSGRWKHGSIVGAKHPKFCLMVPEILEAWPTVKLVVVDRPMDESVASLVKAGWWKAGHPANGGRWAQALLERMLNKRDADLQNVSPERILRLNFLDVLQDPRAAAENLAAFAGLSSTPNQLAEAVDHVDDSLYRNRVSETVDELMEAAA